MQTDLFTLMQQLKTSQQAFALASVVATEGSVSAKLGAKAVISADGQLLAGWVGGGCAESECRAEAVVAIESQQGKLIHIDMTDEVLGSGMPCGGAMSIYIDPILPAPTLWIIGHGRIAESLCTQGNELGLRTVINDPLADRQRFPRADELVRDDLDYSQLTPAPTDFVIIATQHKGDHESLAQVLQTEVSYIGVIASQKRAGLIVDHFRDQGLPDTQLQRIRTPCGLDLGARTPEEIAQSILAEVTLLRRHGHTDTRLLAQTGSLNHA